MNEETLARIEKKVNIIGAILLSVIAYTLVLLILLTELYMFQIYRISLPLAAVIPMLILIGFACGKLINKFFTTPKK